MDNRRSMPLVARMFVTIAFFLSATASAANIHVYFVYEQGAFANNNPSVFANLMAGQISTAFQNSNLSHSISWDYYPIAHPFNSTSATTDLQLRTELRSVGMSPDNVMNIRYQVSADVIVYVVDHYKSSSTGSEGCAFNFGVPGTLVNLFDIAKVGFLVLNDDCALSNTQVVQHEFGHVLFAEHQACQIDPFHCDDDFVNPSRKNHPMVYFSPSPGFQTLMASKNTLAGPSAIWTQFFSDPAETFSTSSGPLPAGDGLSADNQDMIEDDTANIVSLYRTPSPTLESPVCEFQFGGCWSGQPQFVYSAFAQGGVPVDFVQMERRTNGGPWEELYSGLPGCVTAAAQPLSSQIFRAILHSTIFGTSECQITFIANACQAQF